MFCAVKMEVVTCARARRRKNHTQHNSVHATVRRWAPKFSAGSNVRPNSLKWSASGIVVTSTVVAGFEGNLVVERRSSFKVACRVHSGHFP